MLKRRPSGSMPEEGKRLKKEEQPEEDVGKLVVDKTLSFEDRLKQFKEYTKDMDLGKEMEPHLRQFFHDGEISNWWNKLKREIDKDGGHIKVTWDDIKKMKQGSQEAKREVLCLRLSKPDVWKTFAVTQMHSLLETKSSEVERRWMCRGELIQKVGAATAEDWICRGKLDKGEDSDGDSIYRFKSKTTRESVENQKRPKCSALGK